MKVEHIFYKQNEIKTLEPVMKANGAIVMHRPREALNVDLVELVHQENIRLQHQLLIEREHHESWRQGKQVAEYELSQCNKSKKILERKLRVQQSLKSANNSLLLAELESIQVQESRLFEKLNFKTNECIELKAMLESKDQEIKNLIYKLKTK